jgi:L-lactate dehydrogenase complex protein LldF
MSQRTGSADHPSNARRFLADPERARWHDQTLWQIRQKRDVSASAVPEWESLRTLAAQIKLHTLSRLPDYLEQFADNAERLGARVHFALDAAEHNRIVLELLRERGVTRVVKSKSMLTEECGLNPWLERHGIEIVDTDLGELIVQLRDEPPSHIVMPAIHLKRSDVGALFKERLGSDGGSDPAALTEVARGYLRQKFLAAQAGITGVNFAVAETGGIVVCTNEGNADLGTALPPLHIACLGIEKLVPRAADLGVFLRLLARSATGQAVTAYSSHFHGPRAGGELHIVLVDNGRSKIRAEQAHRSALTCIRCGACMNTCPVYRRSGGHSYGTHVPGPIGSILAPLYMGSRYASLPYACSLCGSCSQVCPVKINLHEQLLELRQDRRPEHTMDASELVRPPVLPARRSKRWLGTVTAWVLTSPRRTALIGSVARFVGRHWPALLRQGPLAPWFRARELPELPAQSFSQLYRARPARSPGGKPS